MSPVWSCLADVKPIPVVETSLSRTSSVSWRGSVRQKRTRALVRSVMGMRGADRRILRWRTPETAACTSASAALWK